MKPGIQSEASARAYTRARAHTHTHTHTHTILWHLNMTAVEVRAIDHSQESGS